MGVASSPLPRVVVLPVPHRRIAYANRVADLEAKAALAMHPSFDGVASKVDQLISGVSTVARSIATIIPLFLVRKFDRPPPRPKEAEIGAKHLGDHSWEFDSGIASLGCSYCFQVQEGPRDTLPMLG